MNVTLCRDALLAGLLTLLAGCAVGPDYKAPPRTAVVNALAAKGAFLEGRGEMFAPAPPPGAWWRLYEDPVLDDLVLHALAANTDLRVAAATLDRSKSYLRIADDARLPGTHLEASVAYGHPSGEESLQFESVPNGGLYSLGGGVSYDLDLFGKIRRGIEAAEADLEATRAAYDLVRINVVAQTAGAYVDACAAGHEIAVARQSLDEQRRSFELTTRLATAGRATDLDATRAEALVLQYDARIPPLEARRRSALYRLAILTGHPPAEYPRAVETCVLPPPLRQPLPVGDGAALLRRRPDIRQAERALAATTARIGVATADLYPTVSLGLGAGSTGITPDFLKPATNQWSIGPLVSWTFPNINVARARIADAEAQTRGALARFDGVVLRALYETEHELSRYTEDLERHRSLQSARDRSALAASETTRLYASGRESFLPVLDAQRTLATTESALAASESDVSADQIALFLALGGGWEEQAAPSGPVTRPGSSR